MMTDPDTPRVGWIASGVMGASVAGHLIDAGYATTLTTRTREEAADLKGTAALGLRPRRNYSPPPASSGHDRRRPE